MPLVTVLCAALLSQGVTVSAADTRVQRSPYNWFVSKDSIQTANPGAYLDLGFTGTSVSVNVDVSPFTSHHVPAEHYPVVRYSVDGQPETTTQLTPETRVLACGSALRAGNHTLRLEYVAGYVFLDFWTPINILRLSSFTLSPGGTLWRPTVRPRSALFLGDSITNGDDDIATRSKGITNDVDTQDATIGYPAVVAAGLDAEYGVVAYGGASWDGRAADGQTPGLMTSATMLDQTHSRLDGGKLSPAPDDIFINMGENAGPSGDDVPRILSTLRKASRPATEIYILIPFSGRSREPLLDGFRRYQALAQTDRQVHLIDLGSNPYLQAAGPTRYSIDGQHPLASLHALLGAEILRAINEISH